MGTIAKKWESNTINFGVIKEGYRTTVHFKATEVLDILDFHTPCGCTNVKWSAEDLDLAITYKAGSIPKHLGNAKAQRIHKKAIVLYKDGSSEELSIIGIKSRR